MKSEIKSRITYLFLVELCSVPFGFCRVCRPVYAVVSALSLTNEQYRHLSSCCFIKSEQNVSLSSIVKYSSHQYYFKIVFKRSGTPVIIQMTYAFFQKFPEMSFKRFQVNNTYTELP